MNEVEEDASDPEREQTRALLYYNFLLFFVDFQQSSRVT